MDFSAEDEASGVKFWTVVHRRPGQRNPIVRFWASGTEVPQNVPRTPINHRAKFDAATFIHGGEIRNRTNTQNYKKTTNKQ